MIENIIISGFADEIDPQLDVQLKVVKELGMDHICLRAADGKGIAEYTVEEFQESILPRLQSAGVKVSSLGSPIGKIDVVEVCHHEKVDGIIASYSDILFEYLVIYLIRILLLY